MNQTNTQKDTQNCVDKQGTTQSLDQTTNRIREEWRKYCNTDNFSAPPYETEIISDWWLSKIAELLKSQKEELVEKIRDLWCNDTEHDGKETCPWNNALSRVLYLLSTLSPNKENKNNE